MKSHFRPAVDALKGYTPGEQPGTKALVKLNTNEDPYPPSPRVAEALRDFSVENLRRYPDPAADSLRDDIAAQLLEKVLSTSTLSYFVANSMQLSSAKSAYASSMATTPSNPAQKRSTSSRATEVPVGAVIVRHFPGKVTGRFVRITIGTDAETDRLLEVLRENR